MILLVDFSIASRRGGDRVEHRLLLGFGSGFRIRDLLGFRNQGVSFSSVAWNTCSRELRLSCLRVYGFPQRRKELVKAERGRLLIVEIPVRTAFLVELIGLLRVVARLEDLVLTALLPSAVLSLPLLFFSGLPPSWRAVPVSSGRATANCLRSG